MIDELRDAGKSIVYISHRLGEVTRLADRVTVLRDGRNAGELDRHEINHDAMVRLMVGPGHRGTESRIEPRAGRGGARGSRTPLAGLPGSPARLRPAIRRDRRFGGLVGAGRTELLQTLFGITPALDGQLTIGDTRLLPQHPRAAIAAGVALVPEDRKQQGLVLGMAVRENISLPSLKRDSRAGGFLDRGRERESCGRMIDRLRVKTPGPEQLVQHLSGGNQQKVVLGKWLAMEPRVLLMDEPTRGIDVGAKQEIYALMEELAARGVAILFASSEMEEVLRMSDRALVMHEGRIAGELQRDVLGGSEGEEAVMQLATGGECCHRERGGRMKQVLGIGGLLLVVFVATALMSDAFLKPFNLENLMKRSALFGIISIGVAFVIITGGIDLSIGSIICLVGCGLPFLLQVEYVAVGQVPVVSAKVATGTLELARPPTGLSVGDRIGLAGGKNRNVGVYRVASVTGTSVSLELGPEVDDSGGRLTRILSAEPGPNGLTVAGHRLQVRDRVTFVLEDGREGATARVLSVDGDRLGLSESPPDDFSGLYGLDRRPWTSVPVALAIVLGASLAIGLFHGLLIAKLKLQPFVVTLCGLLLYRGITRGFTQDQTQGLIDEYPTLKLIATAQLARIPMTWGLLVLGGVLLVGALVWGWMIRRRAAAARVSLGDLVIPAVTLVMGVSLLGWGVGTISPLETLPIEASEREEVRVDLPTRTTRVRMQARTAGSASWVTLAEIRVEESERTQELTVPSLETIRAARPGDWSQLQVVVLERARLEIGLPAPLVILLVVALIASVFLNRTIYGRYLLAMGNNEQAARYSGIDTDRMIILAYVICAGLAGLGGVLFVLDINSAQPVDFGNFYELYAIAAAVLGGCSLRGGQGTILGVVIGAALMRVLKNMITLVDWMPTYIEYAIIGAVILAGVTVDELVKRAAARRRLQRIRGGADESGR